MSSTKGTVRRNGGARRGGAPARRRPSASASRSSERAPARVSLPPAEPVAALGRPPASAITAIAVVPALLVLGAVLAGIGMLAVGLVLLALGLVLGLLDYLGGAPARLAARIPGRPADPEQEPRLVNLVEGLCVAIGVSMPEIRVLADPACNAVIVGGPNAPVLCCTSGLLGALDRMELEAVVAHELAHLKRGDPARAALATIASGALLLVSDAAARMVAHLSGEDREVLADLGGARVTRYPPALATALGKLAVARTRPAGLDAIARRATASWWIAPLSEAEPRAPIPGRLDLELRVAALNEL